MAKRDSEKPPDVRDGLVRRSDNEAGPLVVGLVGVGFLAVGVYIGSLIAGCLIDAYRLKDAVEVSARIVEVERKVTSSGGRSGGSNAWTDATYEFGFDGKTFRSKKLTLFTRSETLYAKLEKAQLSGNTVPCFVDPDDPSLSVLDKRFVLWPFVGLVLFAGAFGGVGVVCLRYLVVEKFCNKG